MQNTLYHKENLKVLGKLFKKHREQTGYSIRGVSRSINISHAVISDIENCKIHPNEDTLKDLYRAIDIHLCIDEKLLKECQYLINDLNEAIYFWETKKIEALFKTLASHEHKLLYSPLRIEYLLTRKMVDVMYYELYDYKDFSIFDDDLKYMSKNQQATLYFIKGINAFYNKSYEIAIDYFAKNAKHFKEDKTYTLSIYYLSFAYHKIFRSYEALHYADIAEDLLTKQSNLKLKIEIDFLKAQKYIDQGYIDEAKRILDSLETAMEFQNELSDMSKRFRSFKIYLLYSEKKYETLLSELKNVHPLPTSLLLFKAITGYKLNDESVIETALNQLINIQKDDQYVMIGKLFAYVQGLAINKKEIYRIIDDILAFPYRFISVHLFHMAFDLMFDIFIQENDQKRLVEALNRYKRIQKLRDRHGIDFAL